MQLVSTYKIEELNSETVDKIEDLYQTFKSTAIKAYGFVYEPLPFEEFKKVVNAQLIKGFVLSTEEGYDSFLLYIFEEFRSIELNVIFVNNQENSIQKRFTLTKALIDKYKNNKDWDVISYPMLGLQQSFVKDIAVLGFDFVGQAVVNFELTNPISIKILNNINIPKLPEGYSLESWDDKYSEQASEVINESFKNAKDALFDPRFLTIEGSKLLVHQITSGVFGPFIAKATTLLMYNGRVEGVCFINAASVGTMNIPLIGIKKEHRHKGFGECILYNTIKQALQMFKNGQLIPKVINAGVETENYPALRMYRKIGFREDYIYTHSFINKARLELIEKINKNIP